MPRTVSVIEFTTPIARPVDEVFAVVSDQHNAVRWQAGLVEVRRITEGPIGIGTQHAFVRQLMGRRMEALNEYTEYEPGDRVSFKTISGPLALHATYSTQADGDGTRLKMRFELTRARGFFGLLHPLIVRSIRGQMEADFASLKALLEGKAGTPES